MVPPGLSTTAMKDDATLQLSLSSRLPHRDSVSWGSRKSIESFQLRNGEGHTPAWTPYIQSLSALAPGALRMRGTLWGTGWGLLLWDADFPKQSSQRDAESGLCCLFS